jgi:hypothetical protein
MPAPINPLPITATVLTCECKFDDVDKYRPVAVAEKIEARLRHFAIGTIFPSVGEIFRLKVQEKFNIFKI